MIALVDLLAAEVGFTASLTEQIVRTAPNRYKTYAIPKRNGGMRLISQPAQELKALQRALMRILLCKLPVHSSATAYIPGLSIRDNARPHAGKGPIIKMDFVNFFPSIVSRDWESYCVASGCLSDERDIRVSSLVLFRRPPSSNLLRLSIGAPSSPILSNILMRQFDSEVVSNLPSDKITYTRYADDMTFSAPRAGYLHGLTTSVAKVVRSVKHPRLELNGDKTVTVTAKYRRSVTGLVLTQQGSISIGRSKKREIHAAVHRASRRLLTPSDLQILCGTLAYVNSVEPSFMAVLKQKYGGNIISLIQAAVTLGPVRDD